MKKSPHTLFLLSAIVMLIAANTHAQTTYNRVATILQTKCSGSGCHNGATPGLFNVSGSLASIYGQIVNKTPTNPAAAGKGDKLIDPGYPNRSFLLRKVASTLSPDLALSQPHEGNPMPSTGQGLTNVEKELIRQWIIFGAPQTGTVVNEQTLIDYYENGKGLTRITPPAPPASGEGFQIHQGPVFLQPGEEREYQWRYDTKFGSPLEANRFVGYMSSQSHHLILYKYVPGIGSSEPQGFTLVDNIIDQFNIQMNARILGVWQYNIEHELPAGTAYFWESDAILNSNFHIKNYSNDSILAAEAFINIYTQPAGSGAVQMYSDLIVYGGMNPFILNIPNTGNPVTLTINQTTANENINVWILQAHTHKLAVDYDIFLRNSNGSKGDQIYEGFYNPDYTFNQGFYDFAHPPVRKFEPLLPVNMSNGMIHEATYINNGPAPVGFGLTTADEMFITYIHYTLEQPTAVDETKQENVSVLIYPNPNNGSFFIGYSLQNEEDVTIELYDMLGAKTVLKQNEHQPKGSHVMQIDTASPGLSSRTYFVRITSDSFSAVRKVIIE
jgi:hypothetical protein